MRGVPNDEGLPVRPAVFRIGVRNGGPSAADGLPSAGYPSTERPCGGDDCPVRVGLESSSSHPTIVRTVVRFL